jgi:hypothetical protein
VNKSLSPSLDTLLLLVLVPAYLQFSGNAYILVLCLLVYVILGLFYPILGETQSSITPSRLRLAFFARLLLLLLIITVAVVVPTLQHIYSRIATGADQAGFNPAFADLHDGALQMELGLHDLANGKNPYAESYEDTPLKYYTIVVGSVQLTNPALHYFIYLPGFLIVSFPPYLIFQLAGLPFDQRWVYLACYLLLVAVLPSLADAPHHKLLLLAVIALNPLLTVPVTVGMNDVAVILFLTLMAKALLSKRLLLASFFFGIAITLKQSAWFFIPFYLLFLFLQVKPSRRPSELLKSSSLVALVLIVLVAPFAVWNLPAFVTDVLLYPSGLVGTNYPILGYTLGAELVALGVIPSVSSSFPFWILQLTIGVPFLILLLMNQWRNNSVGTMFQCAGLFIFGLGFLSRFFNNNYVGFVTVLIAIGIVLRSSGAHAEEKGTYPSLA